MQWRKDGLFNKWCWENWMAIYNIMKSEHSLTPHTNINSKLFEDLNIRCETIKFQEALFNLSFIFLSRWQQILTPAALNNSPYLIDGNSPCQSLFNSLFPRILILSSWLLIIRQYPLELSLLLNYRINCIHIN